nr:rRNA 2'-O-methyltransferase fibrillarin-like [Aegilops tauschii subsp. strangulata]
MVEGGDKGGGGDVGGGRRRRRGEAAGDEGGGRAAGRATTGAGWGGDDSDGDGLGRYAGGDGLGDGARATGARRTDELKPTEIFIRGVATKQEVPANRENKTPQQVNQELRESLSKQGNFRKLAERYGGVDALLDLYAGDGNDNCFDDWCCVVNPDGSYYYMDSHYAPAPDYLLSYDDDGRLVLFKQEKSMHQCTTHGEILRINVLAK